MTILSTALWLLFIPFISAIVGNTFIAGANSSIVSKFEAKKEKLKDEQPVLYGYFKYIPVLIMTLVIYFGLLFLFQS
jgi:hypothetical protein